MLFTHTLLYLVQCEKSSSHLLLRVLVSIGFLYFMIAWRQSFSGKNRLARSCFLWEWNTMVEQMGNLQSLLVQFGDIKPFFVWKWRYKLHVLHIIQDGGIRVRLQMKLHVAAIVNIGQLFVKRFWRLSCTTQTCLLLLTYFLDPLYMYNSNGWLKGRVA